MSSSERNDALLRLCVLIFLVVLFGLLTGGVTYSQRGLLNILLQSSITGIAAVGQTFVMLTGGIDLSMYGVGILASVIGGATMTSRPDLNIIGGRQLGPAIGIATMLLTGAAMGALNGLLVATFRVPSLIVTLGTWQVGFGLAQLVGGGYTITDLPPTLSGPGQGTIFGVPFPVIVMIATVAMAYVVLHFTTFGRSVYAIGGNAASAHLSGIRIARIQFLVFVISGLMVGLAAALNEFRMMAVSLRTLSGLQIDSIAAVAVGGVSVYGGRGSIIGVLLGTLIIGVLDSGLGALGVSTEVLYTVKGAVIIIAVSGDYLQWRRQRSKGSVQAFSG